jgi:hypothetical protein
MAPSMSGGASVVDCQSRKDITVRRQSSESVVHDTNTRPKQFEVKALSESFVGSKQGPRGPKTQLKAVVL